MPPYVIAADSSAHFQQSYLRDPPLFCIFNFPAAAEAVTGRVAGTASTAGLVIDHCREPQRAAGRMRKKSRRYWNVKVLHVYHLLYLYGTEDRYIS